MRTLAHEAMMIRYGCLILLGATLLGAGCRADPAMELLERELRWQEDEIFYLEDLVDQLKRKLHAYEHGSYTQSYESRGEDSDEDPLSVDPSDERMSPPDIDVLRDPVEELPRNLDQAPPFEGLPQYDPLPTPSEANYEYRYEPAALSAEDESVEGVPLPTEAAGFYDPGEVAEVTLNGLLTGLRDFDGVDGNDGVAVLVEPRNAEGEVVKATGEIAIVVLDPALPGSDARVARWDFTAEEMAEKFRSSSMGRGIHLELTWPDAPPTNDSLQMFVRFRSAEGGTFEAEQVLGAARDAVLPPTGWQAIRRPRRRVSHAPARDTTPRMAARPSEVPARADVEPRESGPTTELPAAADASDSPRDASGTGRGPHPPVWTPYR